MHHYRSPIVNYSAHRTLPHARGGVFAPATHEVGSVGVMAFWCCPSCAVDLLLTLFVDFWRLVKISWRMGTGWCCCRCVLVPPFQPIEYITSGTSFHTPAADMIE